MNKAIRGGVIAVGIVVAIAAYFGDNIRGYYRFKELCETEGGLKVFRPLLKNVGWQASSYEDARSAAHFTQIAFARSEIAFRTCGDNLVCGLHDAALFGLQLPR